jgi:hypothetical protein
MESIVFAETANEEKTVKTRQTNSVTVLLIIALSSQLELTGIA